MPTLTRILTSPGRNARGALDVEWDTDWKDTAGKHRANSTNALVSDAPGDPLVATAKFGAGNMESKKKRRERSILEKLNDTDDDATELFVADRGGANDDASAIEEKENLKESTSNADNSHRRNSDTTPKKRRTILDFFSSRSPSQDTVERSDGESTERDVGRKRPKKPPKFVALNEDAGPISVHIPFEGREGNSVITIKAHCVESKYCLDEPLLLEGEYHRGSETSIARFLSGFGRYCI
jgi:hypothetical protein